MILTSEQVASRVNSDKNIINIEAQRQSNFSVVIKDGINNHKGNPGAKHLTENERVAIGTLAHTVDSQTVADIFGVSKSHVNDLKSGNRTVGNGTHGSADRVKDTNLVTQIEERLEKTKLSITERAAETLLTSLGLLTQDKLTNSSAKEIAQITSQMSQVIRNISGPSNKENQGNGTAKVQIILHQPKQSREEAFDYIEVGIK